ncbi:TetR/AcrR family transcriptional regulator [Streptacidiphilus sp. P02-A3a]|uniref:TetR/AcrR family transcriptional regulator n=1 Tax=Streptacidiphilus sp. P02-A3a TaxID=2704468 RepID=UPI0015FB50F9|nr:TetR/AcrR family transcriptional regulator [Streptacidiphilus sp. P02-A3a]QMU68292.1 TetR/AcrR family transcriptional regulator [Streptacidiphilus sp. P02-A3a]
MGSTPTRRPRADAQRNREYLLAAADAAFREQGTGASLEGIARRAGVAIGTLYGHFPNRRALAAALLRERHAALFEHGSELAGPASGADALAGWMGAVAVHAAAYRGLATLLMESLDDEASELHEACGRMDGITQTLLTAARASGAVRDDVTAADVHALMNAAAWMREQVTEEQAAHLLDLLVNGLRPTQAQPTATPGRSSRS